MIMGHPPVKNKYKYNYPLILLLNVVISSLFFLNPILATDDLGLKPVYNNFSNNESFTKYTTTHREGNAQKNEVQAPSSAADTTNHNYCLIWLGITFILIIALIIAFILYIKHLQKKILAPAPQPVNDKIMLAAILKNIHEGCWDWELDSGEPSVSSGCYTQIGYKPEEFEYTLETWKQLIHPDDQQLATTFLQTIKEHRAIPDTKSLQLKILTKDYMYIDVTLTTIPICSDTEGRLQHLAIIHQVNPTAKPSTSFQINNTENLNCFTGQEIDPTNYTLSDIFDIDKLQRLQDSIELLTGISSVFSDTNGNLITRSSSLTPLCAQIRHTEEGMKRCYLSDMRFKPEYGNYQIMECASGELINGCTSIWVGKKRIANWLIGHIRYNRELSPEQLEYARKLGLDLHEFSNNFKQIPLLSPQEFNNICKAINIISEQLSELAYSKILQNQENIKKQQTQNTIRQNQKQLLITESLGKIGAFQLNSVTQRLNGSAEFWRLLKLDNPETAEVELPKIFNSLNPHKALSIKHTFLQLLTQAEPGKTLCNDIPFKFQGELDERYYQIRLSTVDQADTSDQIINGTIQDVTSRVRKESALSMSQEILGVVFESTINGLIITDSEGIISRINSVAQNIMNKTRDELAGQHVSDIMEFFDPDTLFIIENPILKIINQQVNSSNREQCIYIDDTDTKRHLTLTAMAVRDINNKLLGAVLVLYDVTEQVELEQNLRQARKLEAIGKLAGSIAHDFNNLLSGIMGFADLICSNTENATVNNYAEHILDTSERAAELTSQLLAYSRKDTISRSNVDLHECIVKTNSILQHSLLDNIILDTRLQAKDYMILGDAAQIQNSLINLGINARDAIDGEGTLSIITENIILSQEYCNQSSFNIKPGAYISLSIKDTGCGITPANLEKIFEPFFTTKEFGKGTGLGLPAVMGTVIAHNGALELTSELGKGSTFIIYLPLNNRVQNNSTNSEPQSKSTILLADDQRLARSLGKSILQEAGYNVLIASNGEEALKMYLEKSHIIDVVIIDLVMPIIGGEEAVEHLNKLNPDVQIILSSGMDQSPAIDNLLLEGKIKCFLQKPYSASKLIQAVKDILV